MHMNLLFSVCTPEVPQEIKVFHLMDESPQYINTIQNSGKRIRGEILLVHIARAQRRPRQTHFFFDFDDGRRDASRQYFWHLTHLELQTTSHIRDKSELLGGQKHGQHSRTLFHTTCRLVGLVDLAQQIQDRIDVQCKDQMFSRQIACARSGASFGGKSSKQISRVGTVKSVRSCGLATTKSMQMGGFMGGSSLAQKSERLGRFACPGVDPDNASILVAGGGGVALMVAKRLKDMGSWVYMFQRSNVRQSEIEGMMAIMVKGDAMDRETVDKAFAGIEEIDAVVSTIGGAPANPLADSVGNINLIEAAAEKGVKRFVLVTSIGAGDSKDAPPQLVYDDLKHILVEKEKAEERLKELGSKMEFVIVRPGGLKSQPKTGSGVLTEDLHVCGVIHREDVADLVVECLFSENAKNKVLSAVDSIQLIGGDPKFEVFAA
ncbi:hypothetical protein BSKO_08476 [Bryopsis sp. KO-2023]|nr:hypothetical protein BSKO_08476 [Bryopsis sp. KO-2023]